MKKLIHILSFCLFLNMPAILPAQNQPAAPGNTAISPICPRIAMMISHSQDLKLSDSQLQQLQALQADLVRNNSPVLNELSTARSSLAGMMNAPAPDLTAMKDTMKKASDSELQVNSTKVDAFGKAYGLLNNEQQALFNQLWISSMQPSKQ